MTGTKTAFPDPVSTPSPTIDTPTQVTDASMVAEASTCKVGDANTVADVSTPNFTNRLARFRSRLAPIITSTVADASMVVDVSTSKVADANTVVNPSTVVKANTVVDGSSNLFADDTTVADTSTPETSTGRFARLRSHLPRMYMARTKSDKTPQPIRLYTSPVVINTTTTVEDPSPTNMADVSTMVDENMIGDASMLADVSLDKVLDASTTVDTSTSNKTSRFARFRNRVARFPVPGKKTSKSKTVTVSTQTDPSSSINTTETEEAVPKSSWLPFGIGEKFKFGGKKLGFSGKKFGFGKKKKKNSEIVV
jgi:hypothetical protein